MLDALREIKIRLAQTKALSLDLETTSKDPEVAELEIVALAAGHGATLYSVALPPTPEVLDFVRECLDDPSLRVVGHNLIAYDLAVLHYRGVRPFGKRGAKLVDTLPLVWLLDENEDHDLKYSAHKYLGVTMTEYEEAFNLSPNYIRIQELALTKERLLADQETAIARIHKEYQSEKKRLTDDLKQRFKGRRKTADKLERAVLLGKIVDYLDNTYGEKQIADEKKYVDELIKVIDEQIVAAHKDWEADKLRYAADDAYQTLRLYYRVRYLIKQADLLLWADIEIKNRIACKAMQIAGMPIDETRVKTLENVTIPLIEEFEASLYDVAKRQFNPRSTAQVKEVMYSVLGMHSLGTESTDEKTLSRMVDSPFAQTMLNFRTVDKLYRTYIVKMKKEIEKGLPASIHAIFNSIGTVTGRYCVAANTILQTSHGNFRISELDLTKNQNISILTHRNRMRRITNLIYKGRETLYEVRLDDNNSITCTKNHGFLTPKGWLSLRETKEGDTVLALRGSATKGTRDSDSSGGTGLRGTTRNVPDKRSTETTEHHQSTLVRLPEILQREVWRKNEGDSRIKNIKSHARKQTRRFRCSEKNHIASNIENSCGQGCPHIHDRGEIGRESVVCQKESGIARTWDRPSYSATSAGSPTTDSQDDQGYPSGSYTSAQRLPHESPAIFRSDVSGVYADTSDTLVHPGHSSQLSSLSQREGSPTEESCLLVDESSRDETIHRTARCRDTARETVLSRKIFGRFPHHRDQSANRGRRPISSDGLDNRGQRQKEGAAGSAEEPQDTPLRYTTGRIRYENCSGPYTTHVIKSIREVGIEDVWDISVEEDHSYVAQGFINHNSSSKPNLQNIPSKSKPDEYDPRIQKLGPTIREVFADKYRKMISADLSQIELRLIAQVTGDPLLLEIYNKFQDYEGIRYYTGDIHDYTRRLVSKMVGFDIGRKLAKNLNFGLCLRKGTKILTKQGYVNIEDVKIGDLVLTHKKRWKQVTNLQRVQAHQFVKITTSTGKVLESTPDHMYYRYFPKANGLRGGCGWVSAEDLRQGDYLTYHGCGYPEGSVSTTAACRFLGWYLSEGSYRNYRLKISQSPTKNPDVARKMTETLTRFGFRWYDLSGSPHISAPVELWRPLLVPFSVDLAVKSKDKRIPEDAFKLDEINRSEILGALWDGDGSVCVSRGRAEITYYSKSRGLLNDVVRLLDSVGINARVYHYPSQQVNGVSVIGSKSKQRFLKIIPTVKAKRCRYRPKKQFDSDEKITNIERITLNKDELVYDITVEEDHSFVANGIVTHNCYGMGAAKFARYARLFVENTKEYNIEAAAKFVDTFMGTYGGVRECLNNIQDMLLPDYASKRPPKMKYRLLTGRYRRFRDIDRPFAGSVLNSIIQGSAADLLKIIVWYIYDVIVCNPEFKGAELNLQVHDEVGLFAPPEIAEKVGILVKYIMECAWFNLSIPVLASVKVCDCWADKDDDDVPEVGVMPPKESGIKPAVAMLSRDQIAWASKYLPTIVTYSK